MLKTVQQVQADTFVVNQLQSNIVPVINQLTAIPMLNQITLTEITLVIGLNQIDHLLGRPLQGWMIVRQRAQANLWDTQDSNPTPASTLFLNSDAAVVVDIVVY